jgi:histone H3/H4
MGEQEVLVVISKLKNYIRDASSFNTAGNVAPRLSDMIRTLCNGAIERARQDGRKTVMDRDFEFPDGA